MKSKNIVLFLSGWGCGKKCQNRVSQNLTCKEKKNFHVHKRETRGQRRHFYFLESRNERNVTSMNLQMVSDIHTHPAQRTAAGAEPRPPPHTAARGQHARAGRGPGGATPSPTPAHTCVVLETQTIHTEPKIDQTHSTARHSMSLCFFAKLTFAHVNVNFAFRIQIVFCCRDISRNSLAQVLWFGSQQECSSQGRKLSCE